MSTTRTVLLKDATDQDLRQYAQETLGLPAPHPAAKRATLLAKLAEAGVNIEKPDATLVLMVAPEHDVGVNNPSIASLQSPPAAKGKRKMVTVYISSQEEKGGDRPIELGVNGKIMLVERDKDQTIPEEYFKVLENAVTFRYEQRDNGGIELTPRKVPLYPYRVVREAHFPAADTRQAA